jgi:hypothetical protein
VERRRLHRQISGCAPPLRTFARTATTCAHWVWRTLQAKLGGADVGADAVIKTVVVCMTLCDRNAAVDLLQRAVRYCERASPRKQRRVPVGWLRRQLRWAETEWHVQCACISADADVDWAMDTFGVYAATPAALCTQRFVDQLPRSATA